MSLGDRHVDEKLTVPEAKAFYTPGEVARMYGVSPKTVSNWCDSGRIASITTPSGHRRIPASAIEGGREYDAKLRAFQDLMAAKTDGLPVPTDEGIADQVVSRRRREQERAARRS
jgi:excisionase family DNA binding protein